MKHVYRGLERVHVLFTVLVITLTLFAASQSHAASMSNYLEGEIIKYWLQNDSGVASKPATVYVGLSTAACSDSSFGTEVSGGSYARVAVTNNSTNWAGPTSNNGTVSNGSAITFPSPTASWGTVSHFFVADASTSGNLLFCAALTTSKTINNGDAAPSFGAGALTIQIDN